MNNLCNKNLRSTDHENIKIKVASADIIVHKIDGKPYYEIKYYDISNNEYHIGFGSYNLNFVFKYLEDCFDVIEDGQLKLMSDTRMLSIKKEQSSFESDMESIISARMRPITGKKVTTRSFGCENCKKKNTCEYHFKFQDQIVKLNCKLKEEGIPVSIQTPLYEGIICKELDPLD